MPADTNYLDKKRFDWKLEVSKAGRINLKLNFEYPEFISVGEADSVKVKFNNASKWLNADDSQMLSLSDGYELVMPIPPQSK